MKRDDTEVERLRKRFCKIAKKLHKEYRAGESAAMNRVNKIIMMPRLTLMNIQHVVAVEGFS